MSENAFQSSENGQEIQQSDIDQLGTTSGLADDHVLAELLRLAPYDGVTVQKAILTSGYKSSPNGAVVQTSGRNDGSISVGPFRAVVGSRTAQNATPGGITTDSDALANWRDVRSGVFVGGTTSLTQAFVVAPNSSGQPRWDLVYAKIIPDAAGPNVSRRVKDPTSGNITVATVEAYVYSPVTVAIVQGVTGATPAFPALPADGAGAYYIPLAYVRVASPTTGSTMFQAEDIRSTTVNGISDYADVKAGLHIKPCNANNDANSIFNTSGGPFLYDPSSAGSRPGAWLPADWTGGTSFLAQVDNDSTSSASWSHQSLGLVDSSIDWRFRFVKVTAVSQNGVKFSADSTVTAGSGGMPYGGNPTGPTISMGNSFVADNVVVPGVQSSVLWTKTIGTSVVALFVDQSSGNLCWYNSASGAGSAQMRFVFWIETTSQFPNCR